MLILYCLHTWPGTSQAACLSLLGIDGAASPASRLEHVSQPIACWSVAWGALLPCGKDMAVPMEKPGLEFCARNFS